MVAVDCPALHILWATLLTLFRITSPEFFVIVWMSLYIWEDTLLLLRSFVLALCLNGYTWIVCLTCWNVCCQPAYPQPQPNPKALSFQSMARIWESILLPHCLVFLQAPFWALLTNQMQHSTCYWCHLYDIVTYHMYLQQNWGKLNEKRPMLCQSLNSPFPLSPVSSKWQTHSGHLRNHLQMVTNGIRTEFM